MPVLYIGGSEMCFMIMEIFYRSGGFILHSPRSMCEFDVLVNCVL